MNVDKAIAKCDEKRKNNYDVSWMMLRDVFLSLQEPEDDKERKEMSAQKQSLYRSVETAHNRLCIVEGKIKTIMQQLSDLSKDVHGRPDLGLPEPSPVSECKHEFATIHAPGLEMCMQCGWINPDKLNKDMCQDIKCSRCGKQRCDCLMQGSPKPTTAPEDKCGNGYHGEKGCELCRPAPKPSAEKCDTIEPVVTITQKRFGELLEKEWKYDELSK